MSAASTGKGVLHAPWEKTFDKILTPFEEFIHRHTSSGLLLMGRSLQIALKKSAAGCKEFFESDVITN